MESVVILKIGGNVIDDERALSIVLDQFADLTGRKILVHGGGKLATKLATDLSIPQTLIDGRRITDSETLDIAVMVFAGLVNKSLVAKLQQRKVNALGVSGADADFIRASKRPLKNGIDFGWVGDVTRVNNERCAEWLEHALTLVVAPITHDGAGQLLNTNADTIAQEIAISLSGKYDVSLLYSFEKSGVLSDVNEDESRIAEITPILFQQLKSEDKIFAGMIPKLENAFRANEKGVTRVVLGKATELTGLLSGEAGTRVKSNGIKSK